MGMMTGIIRTVDSRGRLSLGAGFASKVVIIKELPGNALEIVPAEVVPAREAWLYKNKEAISSVMTGLAQAKAGELAAPPDLEADSKLADMLEG